VIVISACACRTTRVKNSYSLAFGSCSNPYKDSLQLWNEIVASKPDLLLLLGDIIYGKTASIADLERAYQLQYKSPGYTALRQQMVTEGIYDDNDYGQNDGGKNNPHILQAKKLVLDFFDVPASDERRSRPGLYFARQLNQQVKLVTLDTRTFRDDLTPANQPGKRYVPNAYGQGTILGETQWQWVEQQLSAPGAAIILLASTIQIINTHHYYETWGNMPHERNRLMDLIKKYPEKKVVFLSGDRHFSELSKLDVPGLGYPLYDITCSGLTEIYTGSEEPNPDRVSRFIKTYNYCLLQIGRTQINVQFLGRNKQLLDQYSITLQ
jgi:alkaline phosphatase D